MISRRRKKTVRLSRFKQIESELGKVEADWKYWAMHVLHWHVLLVAIVAFLYVGYSGFGK